MSTPEMGGTGGSATKSGSLASNLACCGPEIPHCGTLVNGSLNSVG